MGLLREEIGVIADLCRRLRDEEKVNLIEVRCFLLVFCFCIGELGLTCLCTAECQVELALDEASADR